MKIEAAMEIPVVAERVSQRNWGGSQFRQYFPASVFTTTQNNVAGFTVGTISRGGVNNKQWTIAGNSITLNQDGAGFATISITNAGLALPTK